MIIEIPTNRTLLALLAALTVLVSGFVLPSAGSSVDSTPTDVDYYTCTMHPSVRSHDPHGKCPICGMDLVPVLKQTTASSISNAMPDAKQPAEFSVPLARQQQIDVTFGLVEKRHFQYPVRAFGTVTPDREQQWDYVSRVDGYVQKLNVFSPGEPVEKNASLLTIYSPDLLTAQSEFINALKMECAARSNNIASALEGIQQLIASSRQRLRLLNVSDAQIAELEKTRLPQEELPLFSPFKGVVQNLGVEQGSHVAAGDHLVGIVDLSVVWVWAQFYQDDLSLLTNGSVVTISVSSNPGQIFQGKVDLIDPFINDTLRTGRIRVDVENPDLQLRPNMFVDVNLSVDMHEGLAVPISAILPTGLHNIAFVDKGGGRLEPRFVVLGRQFGDFYEIKSGLAENERVATSANFLIDAEAQVQGALKSW